MIESLITQFVEPGTRFFIFDSKSDHLIYGDKDFDEYHWDQARYNKPRIGDFFLYRRPQKASEVKGQFYIYGLGKIKSIQSINNADDAIQKKRDKHVIAHVEQGIRFKDPILQSDLEDFEWTFKKRGNTWEHFFQQYGMNEINQTDFIALLKMGLKNQFDALVSLVYDIGIQAYRASELPKLLKEGKIVEAASMFRRWNKYEKNPKYQLIIARQKEIQLFNDGWFKRTRKKKR